MAPKHWTFEEESDSEYVKKRATEQGSRQQRAPPSKDLGNNVLPSSSKATASSGAGREPDEMSELYPCLAEKVKAIQEEHPGLFNWEFLKIDDSKARALEKKINREVRKQKLSQMRLRVKVIKTLLDLAE